MTKSKLGAGLETKGPPQELKFTNYAINKYQFDLQNAKIDNVL